MASSGVLLVMNRWILPLVAALLVGCAAGQLRANEPAPTGEPVSATARDGDFELRIAAANAVYPAGEPIEITTVLRYDGDPQEITAWASGSGLVAFEIVQVDGDFHAEAIQTSDCAPYVIRAGEPISVPFAKSGGYAQDDPLASDYQSFFADPELRLPPGRWRIIARAALTIGECGASGVVLTTEIEIETR
jgi:hypothetical protein